ncbi:MAG: hypothetical protein AAGF06_00990 [Pseudomonadota bacterium]
MSHILKHLSTTFIATAFCLGMSACTQNAYVNNETGKLIGTAINAAANPATSKEAAAQLLKQCAALQARISACRMMAQGAEACILVAKSQSPAAANCVL